MAHVEFTFQSLELVGGMSDAAVNVDCWRATLLFLSKKSANITIDGVPWAFLYDVVADRNNVGRIELGGLVVDGKPVNIRHDLRISTPGGDGGRLQLLLIRQFYIADA